MITLRVDDRMLEQLRNIQTRDGAPISVQVRRGIQLWLESKGVVKAERKRADTRNRS